LEITEADKNIIAVAGAAAAQGNGLVRALNPELLTFDQWLKLNADRIPPE
jgi:hypothetical protein